MKKIQFIELYCFHCKKYLARAHLSSTEKKIDLAVFCEVCTPFKLTPKLNLNTPEAILGQIGTLPIPRAAQDEIKKAFQQSRSDAIADLTRQMPPDLRPAQIAPVNIDAMLDEFNWRKFLTENNLL